jgi:PAS domain S-box-containing protein
MADQPRQPIDLDLHGVLAALVDGVAIVDAEGKVLWSNAAYSQLVGPDVDCEALLPTPGSPHEVRVGGHWLRIQTQLHPIAPDARICIFSDVSDRHRIAEELRLSSTMLQALVAASPVAILTLDLDKNVTLWNRAAEKMFGWTEAELLGKPYPLVPEDQWDAFEVLFDTVIAGEGFAGVESRRHRKDGTEIDINIATAPIRAADGSVIAAMAILDDRTEQKQLEARYRQAQKMDAVGRLAGGIAHDFNNALTIILGCCEIARLDERDPNIEFDTIEHTALRAAELTKQLLSFSRQRGLQSQVLDLNAIVSTSAGLLTRVFRDDLLIVSDLDPSLAYVSADSGQLERLIMNLALNARDAMPNGGTLTFSTANRTDRAGQVWVDLKVADTGTGIDPEVLPHIFEPFFTTKGVGQGTGLGLATAYGIVVNQSGGEISAAQNPVGGTIFTVALRVAMESPKQGLSPSPSRSAEPSRS